MQAYCDTLPKGLSGESLTVQKYGPAHPRAGEWLCGGKYGITPEEEEAESLGITVDELRCKKSGGEWSPIFGKCIPKAAPFPGQTDPDPSSDPNEGQQKCEYDGGIWNPTAKSCTKPVPTCGANEFYNQSTKTCEPYTTAGSEGEKTCADKKGVWNPTTGECTLPVVEPTDPNGGGGGGGGTATTDKPEEKSYGGLVAGLLLLTGVVVGVGVWYNKTSPKEQPRARTA